MSLRASTLSGSDSASTRSEPMPPSSPLTALAKRWSQAKSAERANAQSYLKELCAALGVEEPRPAGTGYEFEFPVKVVARDGTESTNFVDLYKASHFALEAKDEDAGKSKDMLLRKAFGQVRSYVGHLPHERPPYLLVLDVGRTLMVWDRWSGDYGGFNAGRRIDLTRLGERQEDADLLRDIWENPAARNPRSKAVAVTKHLAERLAKLAAELEREGYEQERVARFLMRCVFTMFAEDVGLLDGEPFRHIIDDVALNNPAEFVPLAEELWRAMDEGKRFLLRKLLRFNGHFFTDAEALPLNREALALLLTASEADWAHVEPTIFGTLLTRALDPAERHKLGAEYTPREFVERVVRPTVEEPIRERWTLVQAEVLQLRETGKKKNLAQAEKRLREFHAWLQELQFLDPACGSGNFLYVTMHLVKRIELEVIRLLEDVTEKQELRMAEVGPWQFHGIEVKPWAREIAELTLWIGFHQFWKEHHSVQPPEPILKDTGTLEHRDAVLAWDSLRHLPERDSPDPTPRIQDPITDSLVPDPAAKRPYMEHTNARRAPWPAADFIIGNPPYLGNKRMREVFGDGYVDALRRAYPELPDSVDFVMYWWARAAQEVAAGRTLRAGLITTNSITQLFHQPVVANAAESGAHVIWAAPDHPWTDESDAAAVRVAMTVLAREAPSATRVDVDETGRITKTATAPRLNVDLTVGANVVQAAGTPLLANSELSFRGLNVVGRGFVLSADEGRELRADRSLRPVIRPYVNGKDLAQRPRDVFVIDFGTGSEEAARQFPVVYDIVRARVLPERASNKDKGMRTRWWQHGRPRVEMRAALLGLPRFIVTPYVARHRFFTFLDAEVAPDDNLVVIASDSAFVLGVLSSTVHRLWADAAGTRLGIGNDQRYNNPRCFDAFPFPVVDAPQRSAIAAKADAIEAHRSAALARRADLTVTDMYNVVEGLRAGRALTAREQAIYRGAACGVLRDLHDELDALVASAYGWPWPLSSEDLLDRLVSLHDNRCEEESAGLIRWLRESYQRPLLAADETVPAPQLSLSTETSEPPKHPRGRPRVWPKSVVEQMLALQRLLQKAPLSVDEAVVRFAGARREIVEKHLDTLTVMGELWRDAAARYHLQDSGAAAA